MSTRAHRRTVSNSRLRTTSEQDQRLTGIADGLHLVDVVVVDDVIKGGVELVEEVHHLVGSAAAGQVCEAHDVAVSTHTHTHTLRSAVSPPHRCVLARLEYLKKTVALT